MSARVSVWESLAGAVTTRRSWVLALIVIFVSGALMALIGGDSGEQSPVSVPVSAESARADAALAQFPGGDTVPAILVVTRSDGAPLTPTDRGPSSRRGNAC